jgi:hypothetical protein
VQGAKPHWASFNSDGAKDVLVAEDVAVGMIWNGFGMKAREEGAPVEYAYPKQGYIVWMDNVVLLEDAPNRENAIKFMDFLLEPENAAAVTNFARYAAGVEGVAPFLDEALSTAKEQNPPDDVEARVRAGLPGGDPGGLRPDLDAAEAVAPKRRRGAAARAAPDLIRSLCDAGAALSRARIRRGGPGWRPGPRQRRETARRTRFSPPIHSGTDGGARHEQARDDHADSPPPPARAADAGRDRRRRRAGARKPPPRRRACASR